MSIPPVDYADWSPDQRNAWWAEESRTNQHDSSDAPKASRWTSEPLPLGVPQIKARPYPISTLGEVMASAAESIARKFQCPPEMAAQSVLAVGSLAAQRLADVRLPYGQTRPLSLFFVTIAASGDRKTTVDIAALAPAREHEELLKKDYTAAFKAWKISNAAWTAQHKKIENDKVLDKEQRMEELAALGDAPVEPIKPLLTAPEPTVEALAKHWPVLPGGLGLFSAEGGQMTGGHGFSVDQRLKTAAALSQLWDGGGMRRFRAGDPLSDLRGRRLAMHMMVQPEAAATFLSEPILRDQGLLSRLCIAAPESLAGTRLWKESTEEIEAAIHRYSAVVLDLLGRPAPAENEAGNELTPRVLELDGAAKEVWIAFHDRIEKAMGKECPLETLTDVASKAAENAARIAGVLTVVENPEAQAIESKAMAAACELMLWYLLESLRLAGAYRQTPGLRNAQKLLEWIQTKRKKNVTRSEVMQYGPACIRQKAEADAALLVLEEHGWLVRDGDRKGSKWRVVDAAP
ncbi:hypothetical protein M2323_001776 [Rhodoblastus acidophilus]|uniref:YfjI family protein n=1 Tax=Rhodoblastus acidophilus TaxID=1074 RepID=UPI0022241C52|nr:YfjI family protein [Rhodoblastus acidophilus]MCW2283792.1 hypothetical protein [Rhodoblastus acidophilus]MCW2332859.1 hypothetical protein [Rhodoblastus acidophilus]